MMTHYSEHDSHCRADLFKPSGKWYMTVVLDMTGLYNEPMMHDAIKKAMARHTNKAISELATEWSLVIIEPHHEHAHPAMIVGA